MSFFRSTYLTWAILFFISKIPTSSFLGSMLGCWLGGSSQTMCPIVKGPLLIPWNVPISLTMAPSWMLGCSILNTFMTCLHAIPCSASGQSHCGHSNDEEWMIHILDVWLMDATYAMSSPSWHNKTLKFGISRTFNTIETIMPSCFLFFTYPKALHCTPY